MVRRGIALKIVPTIVFRDVVAWTLEYFQTSGVAPTVAVLHERFGVDRFSDNQINLNDDVEETIEWALEDLVATNIQMEIGAFTRRLATEINAVVPEQRLDKLGELAADLSAYNLELQPRRTQIDIRESGPDLLAEYEIIANSEGTRGMLFGIPQIDQHLGGIWEGELVTMGGPAGVGKSFWSGIVAHNEWARGRNTTLFTLENSILMTQMRLACCALQISISDLQTGTLSDVDHQSLIEWCNDTLVKSDTPLNIINPDMVNRSPQALIQMARAYETESLIVDQLTFIEAVDPRAKDQRNQEIGKIVRTLSSLISSGKDRLPCLLMHQINREGIKEAAKTGRLSMAHMAESSEVERASSVVASLYQSDEHRAVGRMQIQMLKARRVPLKNWDLSWQPHMGLVHCTNEVSFEGFLGEGGTP